MLQDLEKLDITYLLLFSNLPDTKRITRIMYIDVLLLFWFR